MVPKPAVRTERAERGEWQEIQIMVFLKMRSLSSGTFVQFFESPAVFVRSENSGRQETRMGNHCCAHLFRQKWGLSPTQGLSLRFWGFIKLLATKNIKSKLGGVVILVRKSRPCLRS